MRVALTFRPVCSFDFVIGIIRECGGASYAEPPPTQLHVHDILQSMGNNPDNHDDVVDRRGGLDRREIRGVRE